MGGLTPAHDLRGAARSMDPTGRRPVVPVQRDPTAAARLVHALVRQLGHDAHGPIASESGGSPWRAKCSSMSAAEAPHSLHPG